MATLKCPKCESTFPSHDGWAKVAVSTLMAAPAVPDMATQVRCPKCGHVFAEGEVRYLQATSARPLVAFIAAVAVALAAWLGYQLLTR